MMEYESVESATDNFRDSNILGVGGFGCVYKGIMEPENLSVAVKRLSAPGPNNNEDAAAVTEFQVSLSLSPYLQLQELNCDYLSPPLWL